MTTFTFSLSNGESILHAFRRIGIARSAVDNDKLVDGRIELGLLASDWVNKGPSLWTVEQVSTPLSAGVATIALDPSTIDLLDVWLTIGGVDRPLAPISRSDYAAQANKAQQGAPTAFWFDKIGAPTLTLWPVPDAGGPYTLSYFRFRQMADAALPGGQAPDVPFRMLDALIWDLASRLAFIHAPDRLASVAPRAMAAWQAASEHDTEAAPMHIAPSLGSYFR